MVVYNGIYYSYHYCFSVSVTLCYIPLIYSLYILHVGQFNKAWTAAQATKRTLPHSLLSDPVLSTYFEAFFSIDIHVLIRFGKWSELLAIEIPVDTKVSWSNVYDIYVVYMWYI